MSVPQSHKRNEELEGPIRKLLIHSMQVLCDEGSSIRNIADVLEDLHWNTLGEIRTADDDSVKPVPRVRLNNHVLKSTYFA